MQTLKVEMKCKHILMFPVVLTSANITSSLYYLLVNLKCCFQTNPCLELSISRQPRFHYSIKLSSSKKLNSSSSKCLGGNLISYCACASARTSGRLSFSRFFSQDNCFFDSLHGRFKRRFSVISSACFSAGSEAQDLQMWDA